MESVFAVCGPPTFPARCVDRLCVPALVLSVVSHRLFWVYYFFLMSVKNKTKKQKTNWTLLRKNVRFSWKKYAIEWLSFRSKMSKSIQNTEVRRSTPSRCRLAALERTPEQAGKQPCTVTRFRWDMSDFRCTGERPLLAKSLFLIGAAVRIEKNWAKDYLICPDRHCWFESYWCECIK